MFYFEMEQEHTSGDDSHLINIIRQDILAELNIHIPNCINETTVHFRFDELIYLIFCE